MRPVLLAAARTAAGLVLAVPLAAQQVPTTPPAPMPLTPAQFPPFAETVLANGMRLIVVASQKQPVVSLTLAVPAGAFYDAAGKAGTAEMVAGLLTKGAGDRTAEQIAATIEGVGGSLSASAGADFLTVSAAVLGNDRPLAFSLVADAVLRPTFPASEIELLRTQTLSALALAKSQPEAIAQRAFARGLYGDHPYGRAADEASVKAITRDDLVAFHQARVRPNQALLVVAGAIDTLEARQLAEQAFGAWGGVAGAAPVTRPAPQRARSEILLVHRPGSVQSNIIVGNTTWMATDARGYALTIANQILGGASDSRLFQILREQKGWTYGAYSGVDRRRGLGAFSATAEVRTEVTDSALVELLAQVRRMGAEAPPADEFERQRQTLVGRFPLQVETADAVAAQVATARLLGLANDYVQTYRQRLAAVTAAQAQAAARQGMRADGALIVVVGDAAKVAERLRAIAPLTVVDVDGKPLATEDLGPRAIALDLDRARLAPVSDSFAVLVQGNTFGYQVGALERDGDGWVYRERSQLATIASQTTEVRMGADLAMRAVTQSGRLQGQEMRLSVAYAGGTASGEGVTPGPAGMAPVKYDGAAVPAGSVDDNAVLALLPYLRWAAGAKLQLSVFESGKGVAQVRTFEVVGEETVTVPMGTVETFRVQMSGADQPAVYWIEKAAAHRVIKFGPGTQPIEFARVR
ncbi:MAG: insulinase family protein [Gemmatimonadaceae bacterium]|nr:insulinase family protein [Gemmatimonadaceae bacterium]